MDIQHLQAILSVTNSRLDLSIDALDSTMLSQVLVPYCADGVLHMRDVTAPIITNTSITLSGTGDVLPFLNMPLTAIFSLPATQDAAVAVSLTATGPAGWSLAQSFPALQGSVFDLLSFAPSPTLSLNTAPPTQAQSADASQPAATPPSAQAQPTDASQPATPDVSSLMLIGTLAPPSPLANFDFLLSNGEQPIVNGMIRLDPDIPDVPSILLDGPIYGNVNLDFFEISNVAYTFYCDPIYNTAYFFWQPDAYITLEADISFHAQNKDYTITLAADIYDASDDALFTADITQGIEAVLDELAALVNGASLAPPADWLTITTNVTLTDLQVSVSPTAAQKINYLSLKLETVDEWTLIPDLLELQAIDLDIHVDSPLSHPQVSGSLSGLIGIGVTGTLVLTADFGQFAFGGVLRAGDPLSLSEVFSHFLQVTDPDLPAINLSAFSFYVQPATETYSGDIELESDWTLTLGNAQTVIIKETNFHLDHPGKGQPTTFDAQAWFSVADVPLYIEASYGGPSVGWTFIGSTGPGQGMPIGTLIADLAASFDAVTLPAAIADLVIDNLAVSFNTLSKHFTFACATATSIDSTPVSLTILIDVLPTGNTYTKTFGGTVTIGTRQFALLFSEDATATFFLATYTNPGGEKLRIKEDLVAPLSATAAQDIPEGLEIDFKDVLFVLSKGAAGTSPTFVFGLDLGINIPSLSNLPLVGTMLPSDQTISVNNLRVLISSQALTTDVLALINGLLDSSVSPLPGNALQRGLTLAAAINFGGTPQMLIVPIAGAASPTPTSTAVTTTTDSATWFSLQKAFGPVHFNRVGVQYQDAAIWFLLDAALTLAGLTLSLEGLSFGSPLNTFELEFQLRGLGLDYQEGPVEIGGAFLHVREKLPNGTAYDEYEGLAIIKTEELTLSALGAYADLDGNPSLFIYAVLDYPLGGPSFFFVTGLAAGFGYNRSLIVPPIEQVNQFPLVVDAVGGAIPAQNAQDLGTELAKFDKYIHPEIGEIFFAIGIKYTSFKLIDSFVLLTVAFGNEFEIDVLGLSTLILPTPVPDVPNPTPLVVVQMALKATFIPSLGFLGVSAQLTSASYLLSTSCHLTGGFAFYSWFSGEHSGDFVQTLGGYHPSFVVPSHYPTVPRLGFQWQVDDSISIKGEAYGALTASALMAGMHVQATWHSGAFSAWFNAAFDFLLSWKPFHYDISLSIDLGASYTFWFFGTQTISVDVGASLHIWGPEFSGTAHVNLSIISFDVSFGANASHTPTPIDWPTFKKSFLPADSAVVGVSVKAGLLSKQGSDDADLGVLDPKQFALVTNTMVPSTNARAASTALTPTQPLGQVAIGSMGVQASEFASTHTITITRNGSNVEQLFSYKPVLKSVPVGLWGHNISPDLNGPRFIDNVLAGFEITPAASPGAGATAVIETSKLRYEAQTIASAYAWTSDSLPFQADTLGDAGSRQKIGATLTSPAVSTARQQLLTQLGLDSGHVDLSAASTLIDSFVIAPQLEKI